MEGNILATYKILCKNDFNLEITLETLFSNEKVVRVIKNEFAKGVRNLELKQKQGECKISLETQKEIYEFEARKDDFADLVSLVEEDAASRKLMKKDCIGVELVDIETNVG